MMEFRKTLAESDMGALNSIIKDSEEMLTTILSLDTEKMEHLLEEAHATYLTYFNYNDEDSLASLILLIYFASRRDYHMSREDMAGLGRADFIFYPKKLSGTAFILELKVDDTPEAAIQQIIDKKYYVKLNQYTDKKLAIGISYYKNKDSKKHSVKIVEL